jgi:Bacterial Ig-like domain (group 3)/FG-GAP-like repeat/FG-GAP repeat
MSRQRLAGLVLYVLSGVPSAHAAQFLEAPQYGTGTNPQAVAAGNFGNGNLDLAVANFTSNTVSVLLGNGDGTFRTKVDYAVGTAPQGVAVGDFNGDGNLDLVVTNSSSNTISILLGNGDGTFQPATAYATGQKPLAVAVGYFNSDNNLDIVVTNATDNTVGVFLGKGDGTFNPQVTYKTGVNPYSVAVADFNNDGFQDLAVANSNNNNVISVLLGNGDGTFQNQLQYSTGNTPVSVAVADFNGDGNQDIAVADQQGNAVSILLGNGKGSFATHVDYPTSPFPTAVTVADFNGDGKADLAVSGGDGNTVSVLWGNGDGTFQGQLNCGTGDIPYGAIAGDFNNDGIPDLVVANSGGNTVSVILNNGNQTFQARTDYPGGTEPHSVAVTDFNGDGFLDMAVAASDCPVFPNCGPGSISILLGNGDGTFQAPSYLSTGTDTDPYSVAVGDFNGDGIPDIAVANYATNTVSILLGQGNGTFQGHIDTPVESEPASVAVGDFNSDGNMDLAVANFHSDTVSVLLGNGDGTFKSAVNYDVGHGPVSVAVGAFSGNQTLDLVVVNETDNDASVLLGNGDGTFQTQVTYPTGAGGNPLSVVTGDFNGDGNLDLAVADFRSQQVSVLLGNGNGTFQAVLTYPTGANPSSVVTADFNGDGNLDLALASAPSSGSPGNVLSLLLGNGDGTFGAPAVFGTGSLAYSAAVGDFNEDGAIDLASANAGSNTVSVLLNTQGTQLNVASSSNPSVHGQSVSFTTTVTASVLGLAVPTGTVTLKNGSTVLGSGTLENGSFVVVTTSLPTGSDSISVAYSGDANFQPHTLSVTQTVQLASSTTQLGSSVDPSLEGQLVTFTATVSPSTTGTPTGTVSFLDGTNSLGSSLLNGNGIAMLSTSALSAGTHSIAAAYSGDTNFKASTSPVLSQAVQPNTTVSLASSPNPSSFSESVILTAAVSSSLAGTPGGTVTFSNGTKILGSSAVNANRVASLAVANLPVGVDDITAAYSGDASFNASTSPAMDQFVQKAGTTTALSTFSSAVLMLTASVSSATAGLPTGNVTFLNSSTPLGSSPVNGSGVATFSSTAITAGVHRITAVYSGDDNFNASTSSAVSVTVGFTVSAAALSPSSVAPGSSATSIISVTPSNGFDVSGVALTCSITPAATPAPTCAVAATSVSNGMGIAKLTVTTAGTPATMATAIRNNHPGAWAAFGLLIPALLFSTGLYSLNRKKLLGCCAAFLVLGGCLFLTACGGGMPAGGGGNVGTPAGSYTITVTGLANGMQESAPPLTLTVQ